ncbi:hypothetical protein SCHPADRAFT_603322 [Schizopora paradoxa]|uniref:Uncharacterized protein n=1 Tax=Schizopora paradoxa TaxID=27342 RepID=A0A0H2R9S0_9AGAM|nr:hypothetical protein SCHPADRAFT_603322 [Schizopora paradoxa]
MKMSDVKGIKVIPPLSPEPHNNEFETRRRRRTHKFRTQFSTTSTTSKSQLSTQGHSQASVERWTLRMRLVNLEDRHWKADAIDIFKPSYAAPGRLPFGRDHEGNLFDIDSHRGSCSNTAVRRGQATSTIRVLDSAASSSSVGRTSRCPTNRAQTTHSC